MEVIAHRCAGIDVHLRFLVVCLSSIEAGQRHKEIRTFNNETPDLLALRAWLLQEGCTHVGMESTGVYWMPVYRRLESFFEVVVANAQHLKAVPGRKTDVQDAEWIADLLQHGLLPASFVPNQGQQELRDLTRLRVRLVQERGRLVNRVHKVLEEAGLKLSTVLSDVMGASGRAIRASALCRRKRPSAAGPSDAARRESHRGASSSCPYRRTARAPSLSAPRVAQPD
jgi:transposase